MVLSPVDLAIVAAYLAFALGVGILSLRRASGSTTAFFAAGRSLPGWLLGVSMVATTFAVDTPLVVTGIVAGDGIVGNWFWWSTAIGHVGAIVIFGRLWRRAEVLTDAELVELRYGGRPAKVLRSVQACFYAVAVNSIVLGWGLAAMKKVSGAILPWDPEWVVVGFVLFALLYSALGGLRAVVLTDLAQFGFAMTGSVALAYLAVREVGGLGPLVDQVRALPGGDDTLRILPGADSSSLVVTVFATYVLVQWWARMAADGGGYLAQRMFAARTDREAATAAGWFVWLHYVVRPWPWILVGLAALVLFPPGSAEELAALPLLNETGDVDREAAYPLLLVRLMPVGLLGVAVAALLAAFMSTVDTHIHWGTSYLVNDLYGGLLRPRAGRRELMIASWIGMAGMAALALAVGQVIDRVEDAWKFLAAAGAGMGMPALLRWIWWRMTAWAELLGMLTGAVTAVITYTLAPDLLHAHRLWITAGASVLVSALAVAFGPATSPKTLRAFVARVRPPGFWGPHASGSPGIGLLLGAWAAGVVAVFAALVGIGNLLLGSPRSGAILAAVAAVAWFASRRLVQRADRLQR